MSTPRLPWEPGYTPPPLDQNLLGSIQAMAQDVTTAATQVGSTIAGDVAGPAAAQAVQNVGAVAAVAEQVGAAAVIAPPALPGLPEFPGGLPGVSPAANDWLKVVKDAAAGSAEKALLLAVPVLEKNIAGLVQGEVEKMFGGAPVTPVINPGDLLHASARSRALRTFFIGLAMSVLWSLVTVIGQAGDVDWFHRAGWQSVATLAIGAVVSSAMSYVARVMTPPSLAQLPGGG